MVVGILQHHGVDKVFVAVCHKDIQRADGIYLFVLIEIACKLAGVILAVADLEQGAHVSNLVGIVIEDGREHRISHYRPHGIETGSVGGFLLLGSLHLGVVHKVVLLFALLDKDVLRTGAALAAGHARFVVGNQALKVGHRLLLDEFDDVPSETASERLGEFTDLQPFGHCLDILERQLVACQFRHQAATLRGARVVAVVLANDGKVLTVLQLVVGGFDSAMGVGVLV